MNIALLILIAGIISIFMHASPPKAKQPEKPTFRKSQKQPGVQKIVSILAAMNESDIQTDGSLQSVKNFTVISD